MAQLRAPETVSELFDALGGNSAVAKIISKEPSTVSEMRRSGNIRVRYWPAIIKAAREARVSGVSSESLMRMCAATSTAA